MDRIFSITLKEKGTLNKNSFTGSIVAAPKYVEKILIDMIMKKSQVVYMKVY